MGTAYDLLCQSFHTVSHEFSSVPAWLFSVLWTTRRLEWSSKWSLLDCQNCMLRLQARSSSCLTPSTHINWGTTTAFQHDSLCLQVCSRLHSQQLRASGIPGTRSKPHAAAVDLPCPPAWRPFLYSACLQSWMIPQQLVGLSFLHSGGSCQAHCLPHGNPTATQHSSSLSSWRPA